MGLKIIKYYPLSGLLATSVVHQKEKRESPHQCALLIRDGKDEPQHPTALFWVRIIFRPNLGQANFLCVQVLHHHHRGVDEAILALHNVGEGRHQESGGGRPQEREKGERVVLTLHPRGTGVAEAPLLLLGSGDEALMRDEDKKVLSTSERMTPLLLLLPRSN